MALCVVIMVISAAEHADIQALYNIPLPGYAKKICNICMWIEGITALCFIIITLLWKPLLFLEIQLCTFLFIACWWMLSYAFPSKSPVKDPEIP
jgi:hypothetical protein